MNPIRAAFQVYATSSSRRRSLVGRNVFVFNIKWALSGGRRCQVNTIIVSLALARAPLCEESARNRKKIVGKRRCLKYFQGWFFLFLLLAIVRRCCRRRCRYMVIISGHFNQGMRFMNFLETFDLFRANLFFLLVNIILFAHPPARRGSGGWEVSPPSLERTAGTK